MLPEGAIESGSLGEGKSNKLKDMPVTLRSELAGAA